MATLTNPVTGHQVNTDDESVKFWEVAGYREPAKKAPAKKAPAKKAASRSSSGK